MQYTRYLIGILFSLWGIIVAGKKTLPHVMEYETVIPQKLEDTSLINDADKHQTYPNVLRYSLTIAQQNFTLHLERNKGLIGKNFSLTHYSDQGTRVTTNPDLKVHCYYHGHIVGVENSSASVGLCSGIKGFVLLSGEMYLIEPLAGPEAGQQDHRHGSSQVESDGGPHVVYNYKHLRRKRSSCSHGNTTTFYDHGARPSGMFQLSTLKSRGQNKEQTVKARTVELVLVVDHTEYMKFKTKKNVETRMLEIANHVDKLYRPVGIRVMLVGLEIWSYSDRIEVSTNPELTLERFLKWRQQSLVSRTKHDNAQFVTGVNFDGSTVGLAANDVMCTSKSGAVNEDYNTNPIGVASIIAHEMGHNLGLSHDTESCTCGSLVSKKGCVMAESIGLSFPNQFSSCSQKQLNRFLDEVNPACLLDSPTTDRIYGGPVCGNAFLEPGEECDCGTAEECQNSCCNATTCKLKAGARCAEGECCHKCQLRPTGSVCRPKTGDCDLAEHCTGFSASCPNNTYAQNGLSCNHGEGYCYNGLCPSRKEHCKRLWGPEAELSSFSCFYIYGRCRGLLSNQRCSNRNQYCGKLFCSGGWEFPVTSRKYTHKLPSQEMCNEAVLSPEDNYPEDLAMVPTGTKCGDNMVCYNQQCQHINKLQVYRTSNCSAKCNNRGVCNHENRCHCDPGWAPPFCDVQKSVLPEGKRMAVVIASLSVCSLLLLALAIGGLVLCIRKRRPAKRCPLSTSGQANPVFQSHSTRGSPRLGNAHISKPVFVESTATQHCEPLFAAAPGPHAGGQKPIRGAPEPPRTAAPPPLKIQQVGRPSLQPPSVSRKPISTEVKPLPPSRSLPPLAPKSIAKPRPPMPPVKPKPASLPHTQLAGRAVLMPPVRPR